MSIENEKTMDGDISDPDLTGADAIGATNDGGAQGSGGGEAEDAGRASDAAAGKDKQNIMELWKVMKMMQDKINAMKKKDDTIEKLK